MASKEKPAGFSGGLPNQVVSFGGDTSEDNRNTPSLQLRSRRYFAEALATAGATSFAALALSRHFGRAA
jgi:hypothetical protein